MPFRNWPVWLKAVSITAVTSAVAWGLWMALRDVLCAVDAKDWILKRPTRGACFEFWFNRYQTLIAAGIAAAVAFVVVRPVLRQLREMTKQSAKGAKEIAENLAHSLERELQAVNAAAQLSFHLLSSLGHREDVHLDGWPAFEEPKIRQQKIDAELEFVRIASRRMIAGQHVNDLRNEYLKASEFFKYRVHSAEFVRGMNATSTGLADPPPDYPSIDDAHTAWGKWAESHNIFTKVLDEKIRETWKRVNQLASQADGV